MNREWSEAHSLQALRQLWHALRTCYATAPEADFLRQRAAST
jgi:hypothetical protein